MEINPKLPVLAVVSKSTPTASFFRRKFKEQFYVMQFRDAIELFDTLSYTKITLFIVDEKLADTEEIFSMCQKIRENPSAQTSPILMISNNLKKDFLRRAMHAGINDFLNSPLDDKEVQARVDKITESKKLQSKVSSLSSVIGKPSQAPTRKIQGKRLFSDQALKIVEDALKAKSALSLLLIFPSEINESIKEFLRSHLRSTDQLFPLDSEQFVLLLPKTSPRAAQMIAETLISDAKKNTPAFSLSGSLVTFKPDQAKKTPYEEIEYLITLGKKGLEQAKKQGNSLIVL